MLKIKNNIIYTVLIFLVIIQYSIIVLAYLLYDAGPSLVENSTWQQNLTAVGYGSTTFGDIDNDGDPDLVLTGDNNQGYSQSKIYINNGTSLVENSAWSQNLTTIAYGSTSLADIDNDNDIDLIAVGCASGTSTSCTIISQSKIYINNGTSLVENSAWSQNLTTAYFSAIDLGDIDNDGDLDLTSTGIDSNNDYSKIYINNGTSLVESIQWQQNLQEVYYSSSVFGDINNDTRLDLVLAGQDTNVNIYTKIYLNNGTSLVESTQWQQNLVAVEMSSISFGDVDNDGDLDMIIIGVADSCRLYINNGTSYVLNQSHVLGDETFIGVYNGQVAFGDYDNDGDLDLASTGNEGASDVYNNNNTDFYWVRDRANIRNLRGGSTIVFVDLENDIDLDLIQTGSTVTTTYSEVYINNASLTTTNTQPTPPNYFSNRTESGIVYLGWGNGSDAETPSAGLYYNLRVGSTSNGNQIITGIYGGGEDNGYFGNMMQRRNLSLKTSRLSPNTVYYWSVQVIDTGLMKSGWSPEQNFTTPGDITNPTITLNAPINYYNTTNYLITFNVTPTDNINVSNVTIYGNWTGTWHANITNSSSSLNNSNVIFNINLTNNGNGNYIWASRVCDNSSNCIRSGNRTFMIDTTYPRISLISPANDTTQSTSSDVTFSFNVTDLSISNCSLIISNSIDQTNYSISTDITQSFTKSLSNGQYNWQVNCTDQVNYQNKSEIRVIHINYNPSTGGPSHGGVSISPLTQITLSPSSISLSESESTSVLIGSSIHTITILKLTESSVTLKINPELILNIGETKIIALDNKNIAVILDKIQDSKAYLTFKLISEELSLEKKVRKETEEEKEQSSLEDLKEISDFKQTLFSIFTFIIMLIIIYYIIKKDIQKFLKK